MDKRQKELTETLEEAARRLLVELDARTKKTFVAGLGVGHANLYLVCLNGDRMKAPETLGVIASPGFNCHQPGGVSEAGG